MARPRQVSDEEILEVARRCFLEHGPAVPTTRIAEELGVSQAALFKRFGTKDDLMVRALAPPAKPPWVDLLDDGPDDRPFREQLVAITRSMLAFFRDMTPCLSILRASGVDLPDLLDKRYEIPPPLRGQQAISAWFRRAMDMGHIRRMDPDALSFMLIGSVQSRSFLQHVAGIRFPARDPEEYVNDIIDVLWRGLAPGEDA